MVSEKKKQAVKELEAELNKYPVIGMLEMFGLPGKQLQEIRDTLRGKAVIKMVRKNTMKLAIDKSKTEGLKKLEDEIKNQPALLLSDMNPFELAKIIESSKSSAPAKPGDTAISDIMVKAGPTSLTPGPVIGELQRVKIPAGVEGDKIAVKKDTVVAREGDDISKPLADVLMKLGIEPMEISLDLLAVLDHGTIYRKDVLFIPTEKYIKDIVDAHKSALSLALNIGLPTAEVLPLLISRARRAAMSLALEANIITKDTLGTLLAKACSHAEAVQKKVADSGPHEQNGKTEDKEEEATEKEDETEEKSKEEG